MVNEDEPWASAGDWAPEAPRETAAGRFVARPDPGRIIHALERWRDQHPDAAPPPSASVRHTLLVVRALEERARRLAQLDPAALIAAPADTLAPVAGLHTDEVRDGLAWACRVGVLRQPTAEVAAYRLTEDVLAPAPHVAALDERSIRQRCLECGVPVSMALLIVGAIAWAGAAYMPVATGLGEGAPLLASEELVAWSGYSPAMVKRGLAALQKADLVHRHGGRGGRKTIRLAPVCYGELSPPSTAAGVQSNRIPARPEATAFAMPTAGPLDLGSLIARTLAENPALEATVDPISGQLVFRTHPA